MKSGANKLSGEEAMDEDAKATFGFLNTSEGAVGRIFGAADAAARFGVSFSTLKRGWPVGKFPAPIRVSENRIGWLETDIARWQRERVAERDARTTEQAA